MCLSLGIPLQTWSTLPSAGLYSTEDWTLYRIFQQFAWLILYERWSYQTFLSLFLNDLTIENRYIYQIYTMEIQYLHYMKFIQ